MKTLIILKGLWKKEKRDWLREQRLENFFIDVELLERLYYRVTYDGIGRNFLSTSHNDLVYKRFMEVLCSHLSIGNLIVVDYFECTSSIKDLARIYGYTVFYKIFEPPTNYVKNYKKYHDFKYSLPSTKSIKRDLEMFRNHGNLLDCTEINNYQDIENYWKKKNKPTFLSGTVLIISDIHSNTDLLKNIPINKSNEVIYLGDYIDGPEIGGSRRMIEKILKSKDGVYLVGNHEINRLYPYLGYLWMKGKDKKVLADILLEGISEDFLNTTAHEFEDLSPEEARTMMIELNKKLKNFYIFYLDGVEYICTHAGLRSLDYISPKYIGTVVSSNESVDFKDKNFNDKVGKAGNLVSIHGHCKYTNQEEKLIFNKYDSVVNLDVISDSNVNYCILTKEGMDIYELRRG